MVAWDLHSILVNRSVAVLLEADLVDSPPQDFGPFHIPSAMAPSICVEEAMLLRIDGDCPGIITKDDREVPPVCLP